MSGKRAQISAGAKDKFLIMQDRASAMLGWDGIAPPDKQYKAYLLMLIDGKKSVYDNAKASAEEAIQEAWQYYIEGSKRGVEWIQGEGVGHELAE